MNKNSKLIICILSILSLSGLVLGEDKVITVEVCSFQPETVPPTAVPDTPKPLPSIDPPEVKTTPEVTTSATRDIGTDEDRTEESSSTTTTTPAETSKPEVTSSTGETNTTPSRDNDGEETGETSSSTTQTTPETTSSTTAATTDATTEPTTTPSGTDDGDGTEETTESEAGNNGDNNARRGMDDEEERLISHKRLLADGDTEWPNKIDEDKMKKYVEDAFKAYIEEGKSTKIVVSTPTYDESKKETGEVKYTIEITVTHDGSDANKDYWGKIENEIVSKNADKFYKSIETQTGNDYTKCSAPDYLKLPTPCKYKTLNLFVVENGVYKYITPLTNTTDDNPINFTVTCHTVDSYLTIPEGSVNGIVTVDVSTAKDHYSLCSVECMSTDVDKYRKGYTSFTVKVTENMPTYSAMGSSIPKTATSDKNISIVLKMVYPDETNKPNVNIKLEINRENSQDNGGCEFSYSHEITGNDSYIRFDNIRFNCENDDGKLIRFILTFTDQGVGNKYIQGFGKGENTHSFDKIITVLPKVKNIEDQNKGKGEDGTAGDLEQAEEVQYMCDGDNVFADVNGLCCERLGDDYANGASCTTSTVTFPFEGTSDMTDDEWEKFVKSYLDTIRRYVFGDTNFNFIKSSSDKTEGTITITVTFYEYKKWKYSFTGTLDDPDSKLVRRRRSLQSTDVNWKSLPSPYVYSNMLVSYVNPAAVPVIEGEGSTVVDTLPEELQEFVQKDPKLKDKIEEVANNVPQAVAETTTKVIEKINEERKKNNEEVITVSFNVNAGITVEDNIKSDTTAAKRAVIIKTTPKPTEKPWHEEYWWVILIICVGGVLLIGIIIAIIVVSTSSSKSKSSSGSKSKKDIEKSEKIMETVIPIEKIKQENGVSDDEIYKPFSYEVIMEGYLLKEGHDRVLDKWQRRYFVLYFEPAVLRIYDSMIPSYYGKVYIDEKQSIPLECYNGIEYKEGNNDFTLILKVQDSSIKAFEPGEKERKIHMKVEGENAVETAKKWVECFRDFKNQKPKAGDAWTRPLIIDESNGKITTSTSKAAEKKNENIVLKAQQRRQAHMTPTQN